MLNVIYKGLQFSFSKSNCGPLNKTFSFTDDAPIWLLLPFTFWIRRVYSFYENSVIPITGVIVYAEK